jgi:tetratricopeptide (TPR) repeat protein
MNLYLTANEKRLLNLFGSPDIDIDIETVIYKLNNKTLEEDIFVEETPYLKKIYLMMVDYRHKEYIPLLDIKLMLPWAKVHSFYYSGEPNDNSPVELGLGYLNNITDRVKDIGGSLIFNQINLRNVSIDILSRKVEATGNERFRNEVAAYHVRQMVENYCQKDDPVEAGFHANLAIRYAVDLMPPDYNNLGYYFMKNGDLSVARGLFTRGIDIYNDPGPMSLLKYNLAVLDVKEDKYEQALLKLKESIALLNDSDEEQGKCLCLIVPTIRNDQIVFEENRSLPDLRDIARNVIKWLESYHN